MEGRRVKAEELILEGRRVNIEGRRVRKVEELILEGRRVKAEELILEGRRVNIGR